MSSVRIDLSQCEQEKNKGQRRRRSGLCLFAATLSTMNALIHSICTVALFCLCVAGYVYGVVAGGAAAVGAHMLMKKQGQPAAP
jgi:hypothetical protein